MVVPGDNIDPRQNIVNSNWFVHGKHTCFTGRTAGVKVSVDSLIEESPGLGETEDCLLAGDLGSVEAEFLWLLLWVSLDTPEPPVLECPQGAPRVTLLLHRWQQVLPNLLEWEL